MRIVLLVAFLTVISFRAEAAIYDAHAIENFAQPKTPIVVQASTDSANTVLKNSLSARADSLPAAIELQQRGVNWGKFAIASGSLAAAVTALHIYQLNAWWSNQRVAFHVIDDNEYKANFDKFGHMFGAYYSSHFFDEAFTWTGMDTLQASTLGAVCGAVWETYIEIEDGFARDWGFSRGDFRSDVIGAAFYFIRAQVKPLQSLEYKWSYFPSAQYLENRPDIPGQSLNFIEDYGGQHYWLSADIHSMLPESAKPYWPKWLNVAMGVGGWNLDATTRDQSGNLVNDFSQRRLAWYISLDYDMSKIIPESSIGILNFIRRGLDYWHFPAPAFRITPSPRFFILFPLRMSIG